MTKEVEINKLLKSKYVPTKVITIYQNTTAGDSFITGRDVENIEGKYNVLKETMLSDVVLTRIFKSVIINKTEEDPTHIVPEGMLFYNKNTVIWHVPPAKRQILFTCEFKSGWYHCPGFIMTYNSGLHVHWYKEDKRPDKKTMLYNALFYNSAGSVCLGNTKVGDNNRNRIWTKLEIPEAFTNAYFNSKFTNNGEPKGTKEYWQWRTKNPEEKEIPKEFWIPTECLEDHIGKIITTPLY